MGPKVNDGKIEHFQKVFCHIPDHKLPYIVSIAVTNNNYNYSQPQHILIYHSTCWECSLDNGCDKKVCCLHYNIVLFCKKFQSLNNFNVSNMNHWNHRNKWLWWGAKFENKYIIKSCNDFQTQKYNVKWEIYFWKLFSEIVMCDRWPMCGWWRGEPSQFKWTLQPRTGRIWLGSR